MFKVGQQVKILNYGTPLHGTATIVSIGRKYITTSEGIKVPLNQPSPWSLQPVEPTIS